MVDVISRCLLLGAVFLQGGIGLKMVRVSVPQYTLQGESVELVCEFDMQGDKLYSVSWYKDDDEFYRYVARGSASQHIYKVDGIKVDQHNSDAQRVVIRNIPLRSSGLYRCEVSAEAPAFSSVHEEARMNVVALPQDGPEITGEERNYQVGDEISLNCTSGKSYPPAKLHWYINDQPVDADYEAVVQQHGLMSSTVGLRLQAEAQHFLQGKLQVRCVATISTGPGPHHAPGPTPGPEHSRLSASSPSPHTRSLLDYSKEALFFIEGHGSCVSSSLFLLLSLLTTLHCFS